MLGFGIHRKSKIEQLKYNLGLRLTRSIMQPRTPSKGGKYVPLLRMFPDDLPHNFNVSAVDCVCHSKIELSFSMHILTFVLRRHHVGVKLFLSSILMRQRLHRPSNPRLRRPQQL